jgi:RNA polymerase sigma-70 factor, ECF subfamily
VTTSELAEAFVAASDSPIEDRATLVAALDAALAEASTAWPDLQVDAVAWARSLAAHAPVPLPARPFGDLELPDLYVAFAAGAGDRAAVAACDALLVREAGYAADATRLHALRDEAVQIVRAIVFAPRPERPPAIHDYAGRGRLHGWLRVLVARELVRLAKAQSRAIELEDYMLDDAATVDPDPALEDLKAGYRDQLADAFREALKTLSARDRTLLRYQIVDGLTIDDIGELYRVHRATAARWLATIRDGLVERTRSLLADALGVNTAEAASIVRLVHSQLEVSVIRHLGPGRKR